MYAVTCTISRKSTKERLSYASHGDVDSAYNDLKAFDFIFIFHLMKEIMGIINILCKALQQQYHNVVNVMYLVCTTKALIQELKNGWDKF